MTATLPFLRDVRRIFLDRNNFSDSDVAQLLRALIALRPQELCLSGNKIGQKTIDVLMQRNYTDVRTIKLAQMQVKINHSLILSFSSFHSLNSVDLSGNELSPSAAKALADFIKD